MKNKKNTQKEKHQPSTREQNSKKKTLEDITTFFSWRLKPVPDAFLEHLAEELLYWAINDQNALKLSQFFTLKSIDDSDFNKWIKRNENLAKARNRAMRIIGDRRETEALKGNLNAQMVSFTMPRYDPNWKLLTEWRAKLKNQAEQEKNEQKIVIIERYPESDIVPPKKEE